MKKIVVVCLLLAVMGCAGVQLTPEMTRITSVTDPAKCQYIGNFTVTTEPYDMMRYIQYNTGVFGGDSYKILASTPMRIGNIDGFLATSFEIYKCK